jgi:prepilin-type N-terminal cleavage/methylation domain-containing protein
MKYRSDSLRRGMTLAELLVVVVILGLLSVVVLPVLNGRSEKRQLTDAAEAVSVHLGQQASRAIGSRSGAAAWYEAETTGSGGGSAVVALRSGRPRSGVSGSTTVEPLAGTGTGAATVVLACSADVLPAPIEFAGIPAVFTAYKDPNDETRSWIQLADAGTNRTTTNLAFPGGQADPSARLAIPYTLRLPPQRRMSGAVAPLSDNTCIDLTGSTIGVHGFSPSVTSTGDAKTVAIEFDRCGRPVAAWRQLSSTSAWARTALTASTPMALLVGLRSQVGAAYGSSSTVDDPGVNWQNPQARWVLVDSRTSMVRVVEIPSDILKNLPQNFTKAQAVEASQALVVRALRGL